MTWVANRKRLIEALHSRQNHPSPQTSRKTFRTQPHPFQYENRYQRNPTTTTRCNLINTLERRGNAFTPEGVYRTPAQHQHSQYEKYTKRTKPVQIATPFHRPKGPCYHCRAMGHYAADCTQNEEPSINYTNEEETPLDHPDNQSSEMGKTYDYMNDEDPGMDQIPGPTIRPQINLAQIGAQMNTLTNEEYNELIQMMGETHPQDFL